MSQQWNYLLHTTTLTCSRCGNLITELRFANGEVYQCKLGTKELHESYCIAMTARPKKGQRKKQEHPEQLKLF